MDIVYLITDTVTNLKYIGSKKNWKGAGTYFGSPNCKSPRFKKYKMQQDWKEALQIRKETFLFEILEQYDCINHVELTERELFWQKKFDVVRSMEYINAGFAKHGFHGNIYDQLTEENARIIKEKISKSMKERYENMSFSYRKELSKKFQGPLNGNYGNKWTLEQKEDMSKKMKDYYAKNVSYKKGKTHTEIFGLEKALEISAKLSLHASERIGEKNAFFGKHHSKDSKEKIAKANKGRKPANTKKVKIDGVVYEGLFEASKAIGVKPTTIWHRIRSKNEKFVSYTYCDEKE